MKKESSFRKRAERLQKDAWFKNKGFLKGSVIKREEFRAAFQDPNETYLKTKQLML